MRHSGKTLQWAFLLLSFVARFDLNPARAEPPKQHVTVTCNTLLQKVRHSQQAVTTSIAAFKAIPNNKNSASSLSKRIAANDNNLRRSLRRMEALNCANKLPSAAQPFLPQAAPGQVNQLKNPGFEQGAVNWQNATAAGRKIVTDLQLVHTGNAALQISPSKTSSREVHQDFGVPSAASGRDYYAAIYKKGSAPAVVVLKWFNALVAPNKVGTRNLIGADSLVINSALSSADWELWELSAASPSGAVQGRLEISVAGSATDSKAVDWFDDAGFFFTGIDPATPTPTPTQTPTPGGTIPSEMAAANITSGTSPLAVYFDATTALSQVLQPSDGLHERMVYSWDFGDPTSGNWTTGNQSAGANTSRNKASGFLAAHVFELPVDALTGQCTVPQRTYTVTLTVTPPGGSPIRYTQTIIVNAPTAYKYVSSSDSNRVDSPDHGTQSYPYATIAYGLSQISSGQRLLLKRDDSWSFVDNFAFEVGSGKQIGAYGAGSKPAISLNNPSYSVWAGILLDGSSGSNYGSVLADVDLSINGYGWAVYPGNNALILRVNMTGAGQYATFGSYADGLFLVDSVLTGKPNATAGCMGNMGAHLAMLGCSLRQPLFPDGSGVAHVLYNQHPDHNILSNTTFTAGTNSSGFEYAVFRLQPNVEFPPSRYCVVTDNSANHYMEFAFRETTGNPGGVTNYLDHILIERNSTPYLRINNAMRKVVVRNNALSGSGPLLSLYTENYLYPAGTPTDHFYIYDNVGPNASAGSWLSIDPSVNFSDLYHWNNTIGGALVAGNPPPP